ncbi:MAG TPA: hypothetical protein VNJ52_08785 [Patescibacteria group bacterium]|nr:hypothetical protein [Patescibacteria group bacterium]
MEKYYANGGTCASPDSKSVVTLYWRVYTGQVVEESDVNGSMQLDYVFFDGKRIARRDASGNVYFYMADALGSTRVGMGHPASGAGSGWGGPGLATAKRGGFRGRFSEKRRLCDTSGKISC